MLLKHFLFVTTTLFNPISTARILCIYPVPFDSHQSVLRIFTDELAARGHQLVVLTPKPHEKPLQNVTEIDVQNLTYSKWDEAYVETMKNQKKFALDPEEFWRMIYEGMYEVFYAQLSTPAMQALISDKTQQFDVIMAEACIHPALVLSARFKAPVILFSSFLGDAENYYTIGADMNPIYFPDYNVDKETVPSLFDKLQVLYISAKLRLIKWKSEARENAMIKKHFGENAPTMQELKRNVQTLILNTHHLWDHNRPVPPSVMYLGSLHLRKPKTLPKELKKFLDDSRNGVIYLSLGSKIRSSDLPPKTLRAIKNVFASLDYDVIWKWSGDYMTDKPKNVRLETWVPQNDLVNHPKLKVFITHAGLQSTDEAIAAHVPLIGLPVFADQSSNALKYEQHRIGIRLDIDNIDESELRNSIVALAENKSYRENIIRLSRVMEMQSAGAFDRAISRIEFIAAHGVDDVLRSPLADLSFIEYYMLDVILSLTLITFVIVAFTTYFITLIIKLLVIYFNNTTKLKDH